MATAGPKITISVRVDPELLKRFDDHCADDSRTRSAAVELAMERYLKAQAPKPLAKEKKAG